MIAQVPGPSLKPFRGAKPIDPFPAKSNKSTGANNSAKRPLPVHPAKAGLPRQAEPAPPRHQAKSAVPPLGAKATAPASAAKDAQPQPENPHAKKTKPQPVKVKKLPPQKVLDLMAQRGDVFGFERALVFGPGDMTDFPKEFRRLHRMVRRRTKNDPEHFAGEILEFGAATIANLILRLDYFIDYRLQSHAENFYKVPGAGLPQDLTDTILPQLMRMHCHLGELLLMRASIARQTELARAKRIENQRLEKFLAGATDSVRRPVNGSVGAARKPIGKKQVAEPDPESLFQWNESLDTKMRKDVRRILRGPTGNPCAKYGPPVEL